MSSVPQPGQRVKSSRKTKPRPATSPSSPVDASSAPNSLGFQFHPKPRGLAHKGVNRTAQDVFCVLRNWSRVLRGERISHATNGRLADELGCSNRTIQRALDQLEEKELIRCVYQDEAMSIRLHVVVTWDPSERSVIPMSGGMTEPSYLDDACSHGVRQNCRRGYDTFDTGGMTELSQGGMTELSHIQDSALSQEKEKESSPPRGFGIQEAVVDSVSASPQGAEPESPPAGGQGGPIESPRGVMFPKRPMRGGIQEDDFLEDEDYEPKEDEDGYTMDDRLHAANRAAAENRPVAAMDLEEARRERLDDGGIGLKRGMNVIAPEGPEKALAFKAMTAEHQAKNRQAASRRVETTEEREERERQSHHQGWRTQYNRWVSFGKQPAWKIDEWGYPDWIPSDVAKMIADYNAHAKTPLRIGTAPTAPPEPAAEEGDDDIPL